jgi:uncharacterized protein (TIGR02757 family)
MDNNPYRFILEGDVTDYSAFDNFCHRTFNSTDALYFLYALKNIYTRHGGLRNVFEKGFGGQHDACTAISSFRQVFFESASPGRTSKHIPDVRNGSAAKRLNMFLRWMVRVDNKGVDFGLWTGISPAWLKIPLDLHTGNMARKLELLTRTRNDWRAVCELTDRLQHFDSADPVKYDFALFSLGAYEKF